MSSQRRFAKFAILALLLCMPGQADESVADGVTAKAVTFYSDHVACQARIFFPDGFTADDANAAVVLAPDWTRTAESVHPYAEEFAANGIVAMAIDYRGWGESGGFVTQAERVVTDDRMRFVPLTTKVRIKRMRLLPEAQVEDVRNAIAYVQGEPGVDRNRIGLWGSGFAGGHVIAAASRDASVKVGVCQTPMIAGKNTAAEAFALDDAALKDAIQRARSGSGGTYEIAMDGKQLTVDEETRQAVPRVSAVSRSGCRLKRCPGFVCDGR